MTPLAAYPIELEDQLLLPNHQRLRIRPLRSCDAATVRALYSRLTPRTRYLRFLSPMPVLPDAMLELLVRVDYRRRLALLAEVETATGAEVVALGNYGAMDDDRAEVGLVVDDAWQRQGIGTALAARLLRAAEARGFTRFVAHVLWENTVIRKLLTHVGSIVSSRTRHGVSEIAFISRH